MVGFRFDRFVDVLHTLADDFKCGICLQVFDKAVDTQCKHTFCLKCIHQWIQTDRRKECPECRQPLATTRRSRCDGNDSDVILIGSNALVTTNASMNAMINELRITCDFKSNGCPEVVTLESMATHLKTCEYKECQTCGLSDTSSDEKHNCIEMLKERYKRVAKENQLLIQKTDIMSKKTSLLDIKCMKREEKYKTKTNSLKRKVKHLKDNLKTSLLLEPIYNELEVKYKCLQNDNKALKTNSIQMETNVKTLEANTSHLKYKYKQSDDLRKHFQNKCNQLSAKCKSEPKMALMANYVWFSTYMANVSLIEINNIGIKLIANTSNIMIMFDHMISLHITGSSLYQCIDIKITDDLETLLHLQRFLDYPTIDINCNDLMISLNEKIDEIFAKQVINICNKVNNDCNCSYSLNY